jgi:hypothetical protein
MAIVPDKFCCHSDEGRIRHVIEMRVADENRGALSPRSAATQGRLRAHGRRLRQTGKSDRDNRLP